tara:strand:- start:1878 stop:2093 length:216 start_codon:yes stop_codon:yes gene_type:complete
MTAVTMVAGGVVLFLAVVGIIVAVSKSAGRAESMNASWKEGDKRRASFDEAMSRRVATGKQLIQRLRDMGR